ncbi:DUF5914 domain-containing protein [Nocardia sienata]|uniref:DUF5914 domain-containing protein n=1 Tax=Nocardia sienata TaxID=248552 RepID=UPI0007A3D5E5|nr:DUF5914 domain-containing protein [Nocardia sienata]
MSTRTALIRWPKNSPLQRFSPEKWSRQQPTHQSADPGLIEAALHWSQRRPSGNWYTIAASTAIRRGHPYGVRVGGREIVAWRDDAGTLHAGPGACPHLGAPLAAAHVENDALICRWHGLRVGAAGNGSRWCPYPSFDDGVLAWVRLDSLGAEPATDAPIIGPRPADPAVHAVTRLVGVCEPRDIIANRLDPWHGSWFHPYSFARLEVARTPPREGITEQNHRYLVDVTFRVTRRLGVPVRAEFSCPDPRTITMRIVDGEGAGSVVETHATPIGPDSAGRARTAVVEATIASSERPGFRHVHRVLPLVRPVLDRAARRLWRDDMAYAERRYFLRTHRT